MAVIGDSGCARISSESEKFCLLFATHVYDSIWEEGGVSTAKAEAKKEPAAPFRAHPPPAGAQPISNYALPEPEMLSAKLLAERLDPLEMKNWKVRCAAVPAEEARPTRHAKLKKNVNEEGGVPGRAGCQGQAVPRQNRNRKGGTSGATQEALYGGTSGRLRSASTTRTGTSGTRPAAPSRASVRAGPRPFQW